MIGLPAPTARTCPACRRTFTKPFGYNMHRCTGGRRSIENEMADLGFVALGADTLEQLRGMRQRIVENVLAGLPGETRR